MVYKNIFSIVKFFLFFIILLIPSPLLDYFYDNYHCGKYDPFFTLNFILPYMLLILPCIEIKLCQIIAKKYSDTFLMKLLSDWKWATICLVILFILDMAIFFLGSLFPYKYYLFNFEPDGFVIFISFSASFLPVFLMGLRYKYLLNKDVTRFSKIGLWDVLLIMIISFILKIMGIFIFIPLFIHIANIIGK